MLPKEQQIRTKQQLQDVLDCEIKRYRHNKNKLLWCLLEWLELGEAAILSKHQRFLRKTEFYKNTHQKLRYLFYYIRLSLLQNRYHLHIPINTCGKGLHLLHVGPVLISGNAQVGERCSFHINTALVNQGKSAQAPSLGNGVVMGVGSICIGGVHIADDVAIGANAVVTKDVTEQNIAIAGVPAKKISNNGRLEWNKK